MFLISSQVVTVSPVDMAVDKNQFGIVSWELKNLPDKWIHRLLAKDSDLSAEQKLALAQQFFTSPESRNPDSKKVVEEIIETAISETIFEERLSRFPAVDMALSPPPTVLVLSPRDRIERIYDELLIPGLQDEDRKHIEDMILEQEDLSAIVENTGGLAVYPSVVIDSAGLYNSFIITAHEWIHHWLFFKPLGRSFWDSPTMTTLNETIADVAGKEIGRKAYTSFSLVEELPGEGIAQNLDGFDFQKEMRITRLKSEELLNNGDVYGAEKYMEERRVIFEKNGYPLRKLNQAYFAFHGSYATSGASISPIGSYVEELRNCSKSVKDFLEVASGFGDYESFVNYVEGLGC